MTSILLMLAVGLISLFSLSSVSAFPFFTRQIIWVCVGLTLLVGSSFVDFRIFRTQSVVVFLFYITAVALLAIVLALSLRIRGVESWLSLGFVSIQPVELSKLALIVLLAKFFSKRHIEIYRVQHLTVSGAYLAVPLLLVLAQPDLGSALVLMAIWLAIVVFSGLKLQHLAVLVLMASIVSVGMWMWVLKPYQKARITTFLDPYKDAKGAGYQSIQSMIAVGSGRLWGKGLGYGSQSHLNFLPEAEADFVFAAFAEEWGFIGSLLIFGLLSVMLWRIVYIGSQSSDNFSRLYTLGFAAYIFTQSFIHIGANMGVLPITGITLPFASYGGSSLVALMVGMGLLQNIKINGRFTARDYEKDSVFS